MVNMNRLKGKMVEKEVTIELLAERLGISRSTLYRKLSNNGDTLFVKEANEIVDTLGLTSDEAMSIFFSQFVACHATHARKEQFNGKRLFNR